MNFTKKFMMKSPHECKTKENPKFQSRTLLYATMQKQLWGGY
jgi:hypothetical protein